MTSTEIQIKLKVLGKSQEFLAKKFDCHRTQLSQAIKTDRYPTLKQKIINYINHRYALLPKERQIDFWTKINPR